MTDKLTVCLTFDFDAESVQIRQLEEPARVSKGKFAVKRGVPRILSLLKQQQIHGTFFTCGWVAENYPDLTRRIIADGHEVAAHGYLHEYLDTLPIEEERNVHERTERVLESIGQRVRGFRAPYWKLSPNTLSLLAERNYLYDSSLFDDDRPYPFQPSNSSKTLIEFPVEWFMDDWILFEEKQSSPAQAFDIWKSQIDAYVAMTDIKDNHRVLTLTCHPACIGHAYRIRILEKTIEHLKKYDVLFERMDKVAEILKG
ncbi:MAG: polysaccharide deacetylase family protein [Candidatus Thorarchaeota archaeon]